MPRSGSRAQRDTPILDNFSTDGDCKKKKPIKVPKAKNAPLPPSNLSESDSDDDFYSNIVNRKTSKTTAVKKKELKKTEIVLPDDGLSKDCSLSDDDDLSEKELPLAERLKLHVAELKKREAAEHENEMAAIRLTAGKSFSDAHGSNVFVNPDVEKTKRNLRYIREVDRKNDTSPTERLRMRSIYERPRENVEKVTVMMNDLEHPGNARVNYDWPMDETFEGLIEMIAEKWDVDASCVRIEHAGKAEKICNGHTPKNIGLQPYEYVLFTAMILGVTVPRVKDDTVITIKCHLVRSDRGRKKIEVTKSTNFKEIKKLVLEAFNITAISKMTFNNDEVADYETPGRLDIKSGEHLYVYK